jgi:hypothetical protein
MYKIATAGVPSGTILAVHLQKCSHLSNEIRVMQKKKIEFQYNKTINACTSGEHYNCSPLGCCFPSG